MTNAKIIFHDIAEIDTKQDLVFSVKLQFKWNLCARRFGKPQVQKLSFILPKIIFIEVNFGSEKMLGLKKNLGLKNFRSKNFFWKEKIFWSEIFFWFKKNFGSQNFFTWPPGQRLTKCSYSNHYKICFPIILFYQ